MARASRIESLDALRGIAAFTVMLHHGLLVLPSMEAVYEGKPTTTFAGILGLSPLHLLWAGHEAVTFFFVLSGYVLSQAYWQGTAKPYPQFVVSRLFRIYPAYYLATAASMLLIALFWPLSVAGASEWIRTTWGGPLTGYAILDHVLLLPLSAMSPYNFVNPVIWSLSIEMGISLVFPVLVMAMRRAGPASIPLALLFSGTVKFFLLPRLHPPTVIFTLFACATSGWYFVVGMELARQRGRLAATLGKIPPVAQWTIIAMACLLITIRWDSPHGTLAFWHPICWAIGDAVLVACAVHTRGFSRFLEHSHLRWLGARSYSLYLIHLPLLALLVALLGGVAPLWAMPILLVPVAILAADILYRLVEAPGIGWGKKISRHIAARYPLSKKAFRV